MSFHFLPRRSKARPVLSILMGQTLVGTSPGDEHGLGIDQQRRPVSPRFGNLTDTKPHPQEALQEALQKLKKQQYPTAIAVGYFAVILVVYSSSSLTALSNRSVTSFAGFLSSSVTTTAQIRPAIKPGNNS